MDSAREGLNASEGEKARAWEALKRYALGEGDLTERQAAVMLVEVSDLKRALQAAVPQWVATKEPTDKMVSVCLQAFRREIDIHMDTKHPSSSPGHDSMRIALREMLKACVESA